MAAPTKIICLRTVLGERPLSSIFFFQLAATFGVKRESGTRPRSFFTWLRRMLSLLV